MTIIWSKADRERVAQRLRDYGLYVDEKRISDVLYNVAATFTTDTLGAEIDYMIENFEMEAGEVSK